MKIALAQMKIEQDRSVNLQKSVAMIGQAGEQGADIILFPEIQLSPFFPQYEKRNVEAYVMDQDGIQLESLREACRKYQIYASPNLYIQENGKRYDMSFLIDRKGQILGEQKVVHIAQAEKFYEQDYYTPSEEGFQVFETEFGRIGIVICFDRHYPESIRTSALKGAELILIPTANVKSEPLELFDWEVRVQAFQNSAYIAMCNRTGKEEDMDFAGSSSVVDPDGKIVAQAGEDEELLFAEIDLEMSAERRASRPYMNLRRKELYEVGLK